MTFIAKALIFTLALLSARAYYSTQWTSLCTLQNSRSHKFWQLPGKKEHSFNAFKAFQEGRHLGKGSFGEVRKGTYKYPDGHEERIAFKKMKPRDMEEAKLMKAEIAVMNEMNGSEYFPSLFGCAYNDRDELMMALTFCDHTLDKPSFKEAMDTLTVSETLQKYLKLIKGLKALWDKGKVHADFKPENAMTDIDNQQIWIIDLGLVQSKTDLTTMRGTPYYMAPSRYPGNGRPVTLQPKDDLYSVAISLAILEGEKGYDSVFKYLGSPISASCFQDRNTVQCRKKITSNVGPLLKKRNFGDVQSVYDRTTINFTTLIVSMIEYDNFHYDYDTVIAIFERLIEDPTSKTAYKIPKSEVAAKKKIITDIIAARNKLDQDFDKQVAIKKEVRKEQGELQKVQKNVDKVKETLRKNPQAQVKVDPNAGKRAEEIKKQILDKKEQLANLNKEKKVDMGRLRELDKPAKESSELFKDNKNLFKRVVEHEEIPQDDPEMVQYRKDYAEREIIKQGEKGDVMQPLRVKKDLKREADYEFGLQNVSGLFEGADNQRIEGTLPTLEQKGYKREPTNQGYKNPYFQPKKVEVDLILPPLQNNAGFKKVSTKPPLEDLAYEKHRKRYEELAPLYPNGRQQPESPYRVPQQNIYQADNFGIKPVNDDFIERYRLEQLAKIREANQIGGKYGGNYGDFYGGNIGGNLGGNYGANIGGNYGGNYGANYGANIGGNYGGNLGGYAGMYRAKYTYDYNGRKVYKI